MLRPTPHKSGFTLLELVVVLAVIGVLSAMAMPGISSALADTRQSAAAEALIRFSRLARARASRSGTAHLVTYRSSGSSHAVMELYQGMVNRCPLTPWFWALNNSAPTDRMTPIDTLDMRRFNPATSPVKSDSGRQVIFLEITNQGGTVFPNMNLCYEPNGDSFTEASITGATTMGRQTADLLFSVKRTVGGQQYGVDRQVVFRPGSAARIRR